MKINKYLRLFLLAATVMFASSSCKEKATEYPVVTELGELTLTGKIVSMPNPCITTPCLPGAVLGVETTDGDYVLSLDSHWIWLGTLTVDGTEYAVDSKVTITGQAVHVKYNKSVEFLEIEIESIAFTE